jgi:XRE family transcriptional regulator, regulator of sulfur utilization
MNLGTAIKEIRKSRGMTQGTLAKKVGITQTSISQFECGLHRPGEASLKKIAKALKTSVAVIYINALSEEDFGTTGAKYLPALKILALRMAED